MRRKQSYTHNAWAPGLVRSKTSSALQPGEAEVAKNVDISRPGVLRRRSGWLRLGGGDLFGGAGFRTVNGLFNMYVNQNERPLGSQTIYYNRMLAVVGEQLWHSDENDLIPGEGGASATWTQITSGTELVGSTVTVADKVRPMFVQLNGKLYIALGLGGQGAHDGGVESEKLRSWDTVTFAEVAGSVKASIIASYSNALVAAGNLNTPNRLYWSGVAGISGPDTWPALNFVDLEPGDGDRIMGLGGLHNMLVVLKRHSVYRITGTLPDDSALDAGTYSAVRLTGIESGCYAPRTVVSTGGMVIWLGREGVFSYNGQGVDELTKNVREIFRARSEVRQWGLAGDLDSTACLINDRFYVVFFGTPETASERMAVSIDLFNGSVVTWEGSLAEATAFTMRNSVGFFGFDEGLIGAYLGANDNGAAIEGEYVTGRLALGPENELKAVRLGRVIGNENAESIQVQARADFDSADTKGTATLDMSVAGAPGLVNKLVNLSNLGRDFQLRIVFPGTDQEVTPEIHSVTLEFERLSH